MLTIQDGSGNIKMILNDDGSIMIDKDGTMSLRNAEDDEVINISGGKLTFQTKAEANEPEEKEE